MTGGIVGPDWAERSDTDRRANMPALRNEFPPGKLVAVADPLHDMYRKGGVVEKINWDTAKVVVFFVESGDKIEFLPSQLVED